MKRRLIIAMFCAVASYGFKSNDVPSQATSGGGGITGGTCPTGEFMRGITVAGVPICDIPPSGASLTVNTTAPVAPAIGDLWFDPVSVQLYIWYNDGTSSQWVPVVHK